MATAASYRWTHTRITALIVIVALLIMFLAFALTRLYSKVNFGALPPLDAGCKTVVQPTLPFSYFSIQELTPKKNNLNGKWYGPLKPFREVVAEFLPGDNWTQVQASFNKFIGTLDQSFGGLAQWVVDTVLRIDYDRQPANLTGVDRTLAMFNALQFPVKDVSLIGRTITELYNRGLIKNFGLTPVSTLINFPNNQFDLAMVQQGTYNLKVPITPCPKRISGKLFEGSISNPDYDQALNKRNFVMALGLDSMMQSMGSNDPFRAIYKGVSFTSVGRLFAALVADGHTLSCEVHNRVAQYVSLLYHNTGVVSDNCSNPNDWAEGNFSWVPFSVYTETGIYSPAYGFGRSDSQLIYPTLHSELHFIVGPSASDTSLYGQLNFKLSFTTGDILGGETGFNPDPFRLTIPPWAGPDRTTMADFTPAQCLDLAYLAEAFAYAYNQARADINAAVGGYGTISVCDDCISTLQMALLGYTTIFPLTMDKELMQQGLTTLLAPNGLVQSLEYLRPYLVRIQVAVAKLPNDVSDETFADPTIGQRLLATSPYNFYQSPFTASYNTQQGMGDYVRRQQYGGAFEELNRNDPLLTNCVSKVSLPWAGYLNDPKMMQTSRPSS